MVETTGFEPAEVCLQGRCLPVGLVPEVPRRARWVLMSGTHPVLVGVLVAFLATHAAPCEVLIVDDRPLETFLSYWARSADGSSLRGGVLGPEEVPVRSSAGRLVEELHLGGRPLTLGDLEVPLPQSLTPHLRRLVRVLPIRSVARLAIAGLMPMPVAGVGAVRRRDLVSKPQMPTDGLGTLRYEWAFGTVV